VRDLVMRMLAKAPEGRPASAGALGREALALRGAIVAGTAGGAPPAPDRTRTLPRTDLSGPDTPPPHDGESTVAVASRLGTDTDPGFRLPDASRVPRWLPYGVGLVALAVVVLLLARACGSGGPDSTTPSPRGSSTASTDTTTAPSTVDVVARDYLGRPVADVRAELTGLGLKVTATPSEGGGVVGTVKDVSPTGTVRAGRTISLDVVAAPARTAPAAPGKHGKPKPGKDHGKKKGR
jgi:eukaryotic-like serine/threonine-protein kinase